MCEERVQLLGGRFEVLGANAEGEDGDDHEGGSGSAAEVDGPRFRFNQ